MRWFLVHIAIPQSGGVDRDLVTQTLRAAQERLTGRAIGVRPFEARRSTTGGLVILIEAASAEAVRGLVALAFLPAARIQEVIAVPQETPSARRADPGGDLRPRAQSQFVEDVVDVGLDGPLGDE
jgi:hypothetical protein